MPLHDPDRRVRVEQNHRRFRLAANVRPFAPAFHVHCPLITPASTNSNRDFLDVLEGAAGSATSRNRTPRRSMTTGVPFSASSRIFAEAGPGLSDLEMLHEYVTSYTQGALEFSPGARRPAAALERPARQVVSKPVLTLRRQRSAFESPRRLSRAEAPALPQRRAINPREPPVTARSRAPRARETVRTAGPSCGRTGAGRKRHFPRRHVFQ